MSKGENQTNITIQGKSFQHYLFFPLLIIACAAIAIGVYQYYAHQKDLDAASVDAKSLKDLVKNLKKANAGYEQEIDALAKLATDLRDKLENAESEVRVEVRTRTIRIPGQPTDPVQPIALPPSCEDCLPQIEMPYHFENTYVTLDDLLKWSEDDKTFVSDEDYRKFKLKPEFDALLLTQGTENIVEQDEKILRARWIIGVDGGIRTLNDEDKPGELGATEVGINSGVEFLNFKKLIKAPLGMAATASVTPADWEQSHLSLGMTYRPFRNVAVSVGYGRSMQSDMALVGLGVFPMK